MSLPKISPPSTDVQWAAIHYCLCPIHEGTEL